MTANQIHIPAVLAATALLAACAVKQPPASEEMIEEALPETTVIPPDYEQAANAATGKVVDGWLATFGDPELEAIVAEAIQNNLNLRAGFSHAFHQGK